MSNYYVYIDESGQFKNPGIEFYSSIVGGVITNKSIKVAKCKLLEAIEEHNKIQGSDFTLNDIHIAPLLHPESTGKPKERTRFSGIPEHLRISFADKLLEATKSFTNRYVFAENDGFNFGNENGQSRYGSTLCALIHKIIDYISSLEDARSLNIYIAPRHEKCLPSVGNAKDYHIRMTKYIYSWVRKALPKVSVTINFKGIDNIAFDIADIACYYLRHGKGIDNELILRTAPNEHFAKVFSDSESDMLVKLLNNKEYATAYNLVSSFTKRIDILEKLELENTSNKLSVIPGMINLAYRMIAARTSGKHTLQSALDLLIKLVDICSDENGVSELAELKLAAAHGLMQAVNHFGDNERQKKIQAMFNKAVLDASSVPYFTRQEKMLSIRNIAYNQQFNDYQFQSIVDEFESVVKERVAALPALEHDYLTGEMLGTIGQAYAFQSKNNPEATQKAEQYFKDSMYHFIPGHMYHQMAINYLTTLKWYHNDLQGAIATFALHHDIDDSKSVSQWISKILNSKEYHLGSVFNISILLRIAVSQGPVSAKVLAEIESFLKKCGNDQHPYELIYKWIGIAYMKDGKMTNASISLDKSIAISDKLGVAVQIISLPVRALKAVYNADHNDEIQRELSNFGVLRSVDELCEKSSGFKEYIDSVCDPDQMMSDIDNKDVERIAKWLPFSYA